MSKNFVISFLLVVNICASIALGFIYYRLDKTRQQLDSIRVEYAAAQDRQSELRDILRGTNEILNESLDTLSGIRCQIAAIRESYEKMENLLYNAGSDNTINDSNTNLQN